MFLHNGKTTDNLINEAKEIDNNICNKRELDVLLSVGEQITISKLAMCLNKLGYSATSLTGWQVPIKTNENYGNADIIKINLKRIKEELEKNKILIIAGFQGISENNNITTLGRGGSDTTAVAISAAIGADECQIYKDVDGVFNKDPKCNKNAYKYNEITYDEMLKLSNNGAKILHNKCIEIAKKHNICIHVKSLYNSNSVGTFVRNFKN